MQISEQNTHGLHNNIFRKLDNLVGTAGVGPSQAALQSLFVVPSLIDRGIRSNLDRRTAVGDEIQSL